MLGSIIPPTGSILGARIVRVKLVSGWHSPAQAVMCNVIVYLPVGVVVEVVMVTVSVIGE
jgi:hypothetical protein